MSFEIIINTACFIFRIEKSELLRKKKRNTYEMHKVCVAVFFVANKYFSVQELTKKMNRNKQILYYYIKLLRPKNNFFEYLPLISQLEEQLKKIT